MAERRCNQLHLLAIGDLQSSVLAGTSPRSARSEAVPPRPLCADSFALLLVFGRPLFFWFLGAPTQKHLRVARGITASGWAWELSVTWRVGCAVVARGWAWAASFR